VLIHEQNQALASSIPKLSTLGSEDLDAVYDLECAAFPKAMQASYQTIMARFELGHFMLGVWEKDRLIGLTSWRRAWFDPEDRSSFPKTFIDYSSAPNSRPYNAAFVYNLCIHPEKRGTKFTREFIMQVIERIIRDQCKFLVGEGHCPQDNDGPLPDYLSDPSLRFYHRTLNCRFLWALPNFLPADVASNGRRVIFYKALHQS
jgi:hypothetical protein